VEDAGVGVTQLLVFRDVHKSYGTKVVLKNFNLVVEDGEVVRLEGPNGSGKSTVLKLACGLERPTRGEVRVVNAKPWTPKAKKYFGAVLHHNMTYPDLTVRENLEFFTKIYGASRERAYELAASVGLQDKMEQRAGELSFGWRKRLELVRALLHEPKLLLLDEPFVGLDERGKSDILGLLREVVRKGVSVVYTAPTGVGDSVVANERVVRLPVNATGSD